MFNRLLPLLRGCQLSCASITTPTSALCVIPKIVTGQVPFCYSASLRKKKHSAISQSQDDDDDDDEGEDEVDDGTPKDWKEVILRLENIRLDVVLKRTSNLSSDAVVKKVQQGLVRLNEQVTMKKNTQLYKGDEVELLMEPYKENTALAIVHRVKLDDYSVDEKKGEYKVVVHVWKNYLVPNWTNK
uniref:RNA-binding S4 domain-containing protein n=1 Tax=Acrobeloides nanus TaxID=290746 RepID=A0A914BXA1_9BILA